MTFLYLDSDQIGRGDPELGRNLLKLFLEELVRSDQKIDVIGCVNTAVHLTADASEVIDSLKALEGRGARIATCGTCLDHYGCRDKLVLGEVGTMARPSRFTQWPIA